MFQYDQILIMEMMEIDLCMCGVCMCMCMVFVCLAECEVMSKQVTVRDSGM